MRAARPFAMFCAFALALGAASCRHAGNTENMSSAHELADLEQTLCQAIKAKDVKKLEALIAPDFTFRNASEKPVGKAEFLKAVAAAPAEIVSVTCLDVEVQMAGDTAIVTGTQRAVVKRPGGPTETGDALFTDVFARRGSWQLISVHSVDLANGSSTK
jgi:uncharacterized protein (TIGR02246 family)